MLTQIWNIEQQAYDIVDRRKAEAPFTHGVFGGSF